MLIPILHRKFQIGYLNQLIVKNVMIHLQSPHHTTSKPTHMKTY